MSSEPGERDKFVVLRLVLRFASMCLLNILQDSCFTLWTLITPYNFLEFKKRSIM
jgi:hypothetical protein